MANYYIYSGAVGAGNGTDWANAYTTLALSISTAPTKVAGDVFFVAHDHVESTAAAVTVTYPGTEAAPNRIYCVNRLGSVPPVSADQRTTAQVSTTGAFTITIAGSFKFRGIIFSAGSAANIASIAIGNTASRSSRLANCTLILANTGATSRITLGSLAGLCLIENCTINFGAVGHGIIPVGRVFMRACTFTGVAPTTVFIPGVSVTRCFVGGCDLSIAGAGKTLVIVSGPTTCSNLIFKDCKLGVGVAITSGAFNAMGACEVTIIRSDSIDANYRMEHHSYLGVQTTDPTIYRHGGASDGTTPVSWKLVTSVNTEWGWPYETVPISFWNEVVGYPISVTVQGIWAGGVAPLTDEIWIEAAYLGVSGFPQGLVATTTKSDELAIGANVPAGSGQWLGTTGTQFAMTTSFIPQEKGPVTIYVNAAKPSSTFYIDPKPVVV